MHSFRAMDRDAANKWMELIKPSRTSHGLVSAILLLLFVHEGWWRAADGGSPVHPSHWLMKAG
jgi:hypothetical protein|eukprot:COSAG01_NODE_5813_length_4018_cov_3.527686_5_plen_63_part_00